MHRFMWDVHYQPLARRRRAAAACRSRRFRTTRRRRPTTPWAPPGTYTVKLTVNGKTLSQPLVVKGDPRVKTPAAAMQQIYTLSTAAYREAAAAMERGGAGARAAGDGRGDQGSRDRRSRLGAGGVR